MNENVMNRLDTELEHAGERCETQGQVPVP